MLFFLPFLAFVLICFFEKGGRLYVLEVEWNIEGANKYVASDYVPFGCAMPLLLAFCSWIVLALLPVSWFFFIYF